MTDKEIINADGSRNWQANILLDNIKRLEQENAELEAENEKLKDREKLYMSALQKTKNDLERLARGIDTTPHSRDKEYGIKYYGESESEG